MEKLLTVPEGVEVQVNEFEVEVSGEKGKLKKDFSSPLFNKFIKIEKNENEIKISSTINV